MEPIIVLVGILVGIAILLALFLAPLKHYSMDGKLAGLLDEIMALNTVARATG